MATGDATQKLRDAWKMYSGQLTRLMALGEDSPVGDVQEAEDLLGIRFMQLFKATHKVMSLEEDPERVLQE